MENNNEKKLTKWLNKLQQESWQLELVVSGFAIFLLVAALDGLQNWNRMLRLKAEGLDGIENLMLVGVIVLMVACIFITINLILHLILRGIWISTIGLRYVSGDIDFDRLKLAPKFDRFLRSKIKSFDSYILNLENVCSVVFSFTFLIVFILFSFLIFMIAISGIGILIESAFENILPTEAVETVSIGIAAILILFSLIYLIDFISIGYLKRIKWLSRFYYPFYRFFSFITLAQLYRPIYYNLIDNKFGKRVGFLLVPYVLIIIFLMSGKIRSYIWFPTERGSWNMEKIYYDDSREEDRSVKFGSIPSKYIDNGFLELFLRYKPRTDDKTLEVKCPDFKPFREKGLGTDIVISGVKDKEEPRGNAADTALVCMAQLFEITVNDSVFLNPSFKFYRHKNMGEPGLITILDVNYLPRGEHQLLVRKLKTSGKEDDEENPLTVSMEDYLQIPFWKE